MSETRPNTPIPPQAGPGGTATGQAQAAPPTPGPQVVEQPTGWVAWIFFAATMMIILGVLHAIEGLVALFNDTYYLVGRHGLTVQVDYTAWGWTHLVLGVLVAAAGIALFTGRAWARVVGVILAALSALVNIGFLAAYPVWSAILVAIDVLVIWAITVHGGEMRNLRETPIG
jgi:hypothetical protein